MRFLLSILAFLLTANTASASEWELGGKLLLTRGISTIDGVAGSGIVPWAFIAGNGTERGVGGTAHFTRVQLPDFALNAYGGAVGFKDRIELSYTRQDFLTGETGGLLGLGEGFSFKQDIFGAKVRVLGNAVYDQDRWTPQISVGVLYKNAKRPAILQAIGADRDDGIEVYVTATKLFLSQSLLVTGALRYSGANQNGVLGFGGADNGSFLPEASVAYLVSRRLAVGAEYRMKPDNLAFAEENDWYDIYAAYAINRHLTFTAAYADLGSIATFEKQRGAYLSLQFGF